MKGVCELASIPYWLVTLGLHVGRLQFQPDSARLKYLGLVLIPSFWLGNLTPKHMLEKINRKSLILPHLSLEHILLVLLFIL